MPLDFLIGMLREKDAVTVRTLGPPARMEAICKAILLPSYKFEKYPDVETSVQLHRDVKIGLAWAVKEADSDDSETIDAGHLVRGLLCFPNEAQAALNAAGIELEAIRASAKEGRFSVPFRLRLLSFLRRLVREAIWPAAVCIALIFAIGMLTVLVLRLDGVWR